MAYAEVTVVVNGALEEQETFFDEAILDHYIIVIGEEAEGHGYPTQLYIQRHDHNPPALDHNPILNDCLCDQYETDHHPYMEWNTD